jgi:hypothetical protein
MVYIKLIFIGWHPLKTSWLKKTNDNFSHIGIEGVQMVEAFLIWMDVQEIIDSKLDKRKKSVFGLPLRSICDAPPSSLMDSLQVQR